jgi:hypothetical protein
MNKFTERTPMGVVMVEELKRHPPRKVQSYGYADRSRPPTTSGPASQGGASGVSRVAVLWYAANPGPAITIRATEVESMQMGIQVLELPVNDPSDFPGPFRPRPEVAPKRSSWSMKSWPTALLLAAAQHDAAADRGLGLLALRPLSVCVRLQ